MLEPTMDNLHQFPDSGILPVHRFGDEGWREKHEAGVQLTARGPHEVAFIGDSITEGWMSDGLASWNSHFAPLGAANFGIGGDGTYNILWRFDHGEVIGAPWKAFVVLIGTNNIGWEICNPEQTFAGVVAVVERLLAARPGAPVLLHEILPRDFAPDGEMRVLVDRCNALLRGHEFDPRVKLLDFSGLFLDADGTLPTHVAPDFLHLSPAAYEKWAAALLPEVRAALG